MIKKLKLLSLLLFPLSIFINTVLSRYPHFIEKYYSISINKFIVEILSNISGIFPFSIYEITMYLIVISIALFIIYTIYIIINSPNKLKAFIKNSLLNILSIISIFYFLFIILSLPIWFYSIFPLIPSLEVITIFFRTTFKPFLSICRFYRLFLYF